MRVWMIWACLLVSVTTVAAEDGACFNASRPLGSQFYYRHSVTLAALAADPNCSVVPKEQTAAQRALVEDRSTWKYLKVAGGLAVTMTQGEKDAVDAFLAAQAAALQLFRDIVNDPATCKYDTLAEAIAAADARKANRQTALNNAKTNVETELADLESDINGVSTFNLATLKGVALRIHEAMVTLKNVQFNIHNETLDEMYILAKNIVKCDLSRSKVGR